MFKTESEAREEMSLDRESDELNANRQSDGKVLQNEKIRRVLNFLESNLEQSFTTAELSAVACYSEFHFHRLFTSIVGESIYAYRKRLLLERSVKQLLYSDLSITEVAFNAGYENQTSYNKAFRKLFSTSPSQCRQQKLSLSSTYIQPRFLEPFIMKAEIKQLEPIPVLCVRKRGSYTEAAEAAWSQLMRFTYGNKLMNPETRSYGICHDDPSVTESENIRYVACVSENSSVELDDGIELDVIEGGLYAVFLHKGSY